MNTFEALAFGLRPLGILLAIAFAAHLGWRLRQGLVASANVLAWTTALSVWWIGLTYSRGILVDTGTFRYLFVSVVFVVLAMIPPTPLKLPDATRSLTAAVAAAAGDRRRGVGEPARHRRPGRARSATSPVRPR